MSSWSLQCSECPATADPAGLPTLCPACDAPWLVRYPALPTPAARAHLTERPWTMWRYREWLPLDAQETPVSLGEGGTPLVEATRLADGVGVARLWIKDESHNPTGSFKARGMAAAVTRARAGGATSLTAPTAGNAGVALSAYGRRAGLPVRIFAPVTTPPRILEQIEVFGAQLDVVEGHIGDCGRRARAYAAEHGAYDLSTLREPYRIEGKKTLALELAEQLGWRLPDAVVYPTGGGTGLIGMWAAFRDLVASGWAAGPPPRLVAVQAQGCAPVVRAYESGAESPTPWDRPETLASGLRVPAPLGGRLVLRGVRDTGGTAVAVSDAELTRAERRMAEAEGIDACPEGGATLAALERLLSAGALPRDSTVILFNTGAGWLYR